MRVYRVCVCARIAVRVVYSRSIRGQGRPYGILPGTGEQLTSTRVRGALERRA